MEVVLIFTALLGFLVINITQNETNANYYAPQLVTSTALTGYEIGLWIGFVLFGSMSVIMYVLSDRYHRSVRELRTTLNNFDVANARLSQQSDRILLLNIIGEIFQGSPELAAHRAAQIGIPQHTPTRADRSQMSTRESQLHEGIEAFNYSLKTNVRDQLPVDGVLSWNVFRYPTAVLLFGAIASIDFYDYWGYIKTDG